MVFEASDRPAVVFRIRELLGVLGRILELGELPLVVEEVDRSAMIDRGEVELNDHVELFARGADVFEDVTEVGRVWKLPDADGAAKLNR